MQWIFFGGLIAVLIIVGVFIYFYDVIMQEEIDGQLHTQAMVDMETVYETWIDVTNDDDSVKEQEYQRAQKAQKTYIESRKI